MYRLDVTDLIENGKSIPLIVTNWLYKNIIGRDASLKLTDLKLFAMPEKELVKEISEKK